MTVRSRRICVLGNSHLGAAARGWLRVAEHHPGHELTFFGAPWDLMGQLDVDGDALVPRTERLAKKIRRSSGGLDRIVPADYDRIILYGLQFGPRRIVQLYRNFRPVSFEWRAQMPEMPPLRRNIEPVQAISERLFDRIAMSGLSGSLAIRLAEQIRALGPVPLTLIPAPGFSAKVLADGAWDGPLGAGDVARLQTRVHALLHRACPDDADLILPRSHLTCHGLFTAEAYAVNKKAGEEPDLVHTSPKYAAEMLTAALAAAAAVANTAALTVRPGSRSAA